MGLSQKEICDFRYLLNRYFDKTITGEEVDRLNGLIENYPDLERHYFSFINLQMSFREFKTLVEAENNLGLPLVNEMLSQLSQWEKIAPSIEVPVKAASPLIQKVEYPNVAYFQIKKSSILKLLAAAAVVLFVILFDRFAPVKRGVEVATLSDMLGARFSSLDNGLKTGQRLQTRYEPYVLQEGVVKIDYDDSIRVIIEAPAEFELQASALLKLNYGRLYTQVGASGRGFTVDTPASRVVDLGTEFGIQANVDGSTQLHVVKGKATLFAGGAQQAKSVISVEAGRAKYVDGQGLGVKDIALQEETFVRNINSLAKMAWRGQKAIDLADLVGGGNGFGGGALNGGIDPDTGTLRYELGADTITTRAASHRFVATKDISFIDSIFIPGFDEQPTQISSTGLMCDQFSPTSATVWGYLFNGAWHEGVGVPRHTLMLDGVVLDRSGGPSLAVHPNMGITFDLQQMRTSLSGLVPVRLRTRAGLSQTAAQFTNENPKSEFWVLVDGQVRLRQMVQMSDGGYAIEVPLSSRDRFLSLAVSDGDGVTAFNWAVFVHPVIELETNP